MEANIDDILLHNSSVLVVESDEPSRSSLIRFLASHHYTITLAFQADEGLHRLLRQGKKLDYDIVMIAVDLPDMNGFKLLEIISKEVAKLPVIIMMAAEENEDDCFKTSYLGACDCIVKPVKEDFVRLMWKHAVPIRKTKFSREATLVGLPCPTNSTKKSSSSKRDHERLMNDMTVENHRDIHSKEVSLPKIFKKIQL